MLTRRDSPPPNLSPSTSHGATYSMPVSSMGGRLLGDLNPASGYAVNRPGFPPLMSHDQDLPNYASFNPPPRQVGQQLGNSFPPQIPSYNPTLPGMPLDPGSRHSSMGAQDGPPFEDTKVIYPVVTARNQQVTPKIEAKIQKGFFKVDHKWTCYRRNYFTVSCSFSLKPATYEPQFYLQRHSHQQHEPINAFAMQISAKTAVVNNQESELRNLVQHTPKRDKATESVPGKVILQPAQPSIMTNPGSYHGSSTMYGAPPNVPPGMMVDNYPQHYGSAQQQGPPQSHTFERIQFQKATANNGKRRAQQQYFHVVVELFADVGRQGDTQWVKIATAQSHPMVVRGRSPGHYKDNRRDSTASMDPDRGSGAGGDSSGGPPSMGSYLGPAHGRSSTMDWESTHRGSTHMGGSYRHVAQECSPESAVSFGSSPSSCGELDLEFLRNETTMSTPNLMSPGAMMPGPVDQKALSSLIGLRSGTGPRRMQTQGNNSQSRFTSNAIDGLEALRPDMQHSHGIGALEIPLHQTLCSS
jgi:meiosis-specific transcription factor NDT80